MDCVKSLRKTCARHSLLPSPLQIGLCYDPASVAHYRGGFADVWKGEYCGQEVAVKVLRVYVNSDLQKITRVGHWRSSFPCNRYHADCNLCRGFAESS